MSTLHIPTSVPPCKAKSTEHEHVMALQQQLPPTEVVGSKWFSYEGKGVWKEGNKDLYRAIALGIMNPQNREVTKAHRILDHMEDLLRKPINFHGFVKGESHTSILINTASCVLRVTPKAIDELPHDMEHRFTRSLTVPYEPTSRHDLFLDALDQILPDKLDQKLLQYLMANVFIPDARYEVFGCLYGEAGSGKDTIMAAFIALLGGVESGLITNFTISQISDDKTYSLPQIQFAAANICTELDSKEVQDSSVFKALVSGMPVPARTLYEKPFNMVTPCKFIFLSNNMPDIRNGTDAERRRVRFLRFEFKPKVIDVLLKERLKMAHPGMLNWVLEGLQELLQMEHATMPLGGSASREVHERFFSSNDPINGFITKACIMDRAVESRKEDVRRAFAAYAEQENIPEHICKVFFARLYKRFTTLKSVRKGTEPLRFYVVCGLKLNETGESLVAENADCKHVQ